jgi:hypothetical protein
MAAREEVISIRLCCRSLLEEEPFSGCLLREDAEEAVGAIMIAELLLLLLLLVALVYP